MSKVRIAVFLLVAAVLDQAAAHKSSKCQLIEEVRALTDDTGLAREYMRTDEYFDRWLRDNGMDKERTANKINRALEWRRTSGINELVNEDSLGCDRICPAQTDSIDKEGKPIWQISLGDWDVRKLAVAGKGIVFTKCMFRYMEIMLEAGYQNWKHGNSSKATEFIFIADLKGYNTRQHACAACIPILLDVIRGYEAYYPHTITRAMFLNTPALFEVLLTLGRAAMSKETRDAVAVFDFDQNTWQPVLLSTIDSSQLTPQYGGTKNIQRRPRGG